jgi:hypothetical protein
MNVLLQLSEIDVLGLLQSFDRTGLLDLAHQRPVERRGNLMSVPQPSLVAIFRQIDAESLLNDFVAQLLLNIPSVFRRSGPA